MGKSREHAAFKRISDVLKYFPSLPWPVFHFPFSHFHNFFVSSTLAARLNKRFAVGLCVISQGLSRAGRGGGEDLQNMMAGLKLEGCVGGGGVVGRSKRLNKG